MTAAVLGSFSERELSLRTGYSGGELEQAFRSRFDRPAPLRATRSGVPLGHDDGVADFAAALEEREEKDILRTGFNSGDGLHPRDLGGHAMADVIDLASLAVLG
jgi:hypothetical protein